MRSNVSRETFYETVQSGLRIYCVDHVKTCVLEHPFRRKEILQNKRLIYSQKSKDYLVKNSKNIENVSRETFSVVFQSFLCYYEIRIF